ncbi:MAG: Gfo/Idh/MocA family oxidoreductase [Verrucomicrobia bacterium]|nr:Gfo/Idh/MocA family oxidoreductase [Verrucomicrobiota bacterium]
MKRPTPLLARQRPTRRAFLKSMAALAVAPSIIPAAALGKDGAAAPASRLTLAVIGLGNRNTSNLGHFLQQKDAQCVAVCDCFADRRARGKKLVDEFYRNQDCVATRFHEEIFARKDIDAVLIGTGDRWHAVLSILAARAGKDVYCEKPFCLTIGEGRELVETMKRFGTVWQCGTQRRSNSAYRFVAEGVKGGMVGCLRAITMSFGPWGGNGVATPEPAPDPEVFDYDRWLGQAPWAPYSKLRVALWRNTWDTSAGPIVDMGPHYLDIAQWAHNSEFSGPVEFEGDAVWPEPGGFANVPFVVNVQARYADGVRIVMNSGPKGVRFDGDEGWVQISDAGEITAEPASLLRGQAPRVDWSNMNDHVRNFLDCIKTRRLTASHPELAQRCHTAAHCANLCLRLGRKLRWDPARERFTDDDTASRFLSRAMRVPWNI